MCAYSYLHVNVFQRAKLFDRVLACAPVRVSDVDGGERGEYGADSRQK